MDLKVENLEFSDLDTRVSFLTKEQIVEMIKSYYRGNKVAGILSEYKIQIDAAHLYTLFPPFISQENCPICDSPLLIEWKSKHKLQFEEQMKRFNSKYEDIIFCSKCSMDKSELYKDIKPQDQRMSRLKKSLIEDFFNNDRTGVYFDCDLGLTEALYLAVLLRSSISEDGTYILPLLSKLEQIAPTLELSHHIIEHLMDEFILSIDPSSRLTAFDLVPEESGEYDLVFYPERVAYKYNVISSTAEQESMIQTLLSPNFIGRKGAVEFYYSTWQKIAVHECKQYMAYQMNKAGLVYTSRDKDVSVFGHLLEYYSVSQVFGIIYQSVKFNANRYSTMQITKPHAENAVLTTCEGIGRRSLANGWTLKEYDWPKDLPKSYISLVLHNAYGINPETAFLTKQSLGFSIAE